MLLQHIGHSQRVDGGGQHTHMVGTHTNHLVAAVLYAAPEIAAADYDAHLNAHVDALLDRITHRGDHIKIQSTTSVTGQSLTADLQQNTLVFWCFHRKYNSFN